MKLLSQDKAPIHYASYRTGPKMQEFETFKIEKMVSKNTIERPLTEWSASVVFVPKKNGTIQFCVGYCKLYAATEHYS